MASAPRSASIAQPIVAGVVASLAGFASSFALLIAGLQAVGATPEESASGLLVLCVFQGVLAIGLSLRSRMPISIAWSTPGAALMVAAKGLTDDFSAAVGAFVLCGLLLLITGLWPWLARAMTRIPKPIASAMLAGILLPICLAPVQASVGETWWQGLTIAAVWLVLMRFAPRWAVPGAVAATAAVVAIAAGGNPLAGFSVTPVLDFVAPTLDAAVLVSLGVPLYVVTMAGQNVPGFAVLRTFGYDHPPARAILVSSGAATAVGGLFGAYTLNLSAITAAMMAGPDAHPDRRLRYIATVSAGASYIVLGLGAGAATALVSASPPILITAIAGLALFGALASAVTTALEEPEHRIVAVITFLVVASGITVAGIGSPLWGLLVGGLAMLWLRRWRAPRVEPVEVVEPAAPAAPEPSAPEQPGEGGAA
ncbi:MAG: benzoate/H(+) symporter BenE family transporter [Microbacteriaceae bacterium]|nr:benzoate/H(+) symporter BenE family transporter [Microbacteriaceae bacterium]